MTTAEKPRKMLWVALTVVLLGWNGSLALFAGPGTLFQAYDGVQYQLLARNRLHGHYDVGDTAHTVRLEGSHPMWRPALVWMIEGLARLLGSVQTAAIVASVLGTTLMEVLSLWLARRCLGWGVCLVAFALLVSPLVVSVQFMLMAIGQGPEPWAAASLLAGFACLVEARMRRSWAWAIAAGAAAGLSEWFRTGNLLIFAGPCAMYGLAALCRRQWREIGLSTAALAAFCVSAGVSERLVPSAVDKTMANLWANLIEHQGLQLRVYDPKHPENEPALHYIEGLRLAPGNRETNYDYIVREARTLPLKSFLHERGGELVHQYFGNLTAMAAGGARGLRFYLGTLLVLCLAAQLVLSLMRRDADATHCLALAAGPLLFFLGPLVLLRGDQPVHYLSVGLPMLLVVTAAGVVTAGQACWARMAGHCPGLRERYQRAPVLVGALLLTPFVLLSISFFQGALRTLEEGHSLCAEAQADVNALPLDGRKVAIRNMSWFVDRKVETVLLPYANVPDLEEYALAQRLDGILIWAGEKQYFFRITPYGEAEDFEEALQHSKIFGPVQASGEWRWYPVRREMASAQGQVTRDE